MSSDIRDILKDLWGDIYPENVEYISTFQLELNRRIGPKSAIKIPIDFWFTPKTQFDITEYRNDKMAELLRKDHNKRVQEKNPPPKKGS